MVGRRRPAGTPRPIVEKLAAWFNQITNEDDTSSPRARRLRSLPRSPDQMAALIKSDAARWKGYVELAKIEPQ